MFIPHLHNHLSNNCSLLKFCVIVQEVFVKKNEKLIKDFGMYKKYQGAERFLLDHPDLVCEETANYLAIWCINLQVEEVRSSLTSAPDRRD